VREAKTSSDGTGTVNFTAGNKEVFLTHSALKIKDIAPLAEAGGSLAPGRPIQVTTNTATPVTLDQAYLPGRGNINQGVYEYTVLANETDSPSFKSKAWLVRVTRYPSNKTGSTLIDSTVTDLASYGSPTWTVTVDANGNVVLTGAASYDIFWNVFERVLGWF